MRKRSWRPAQALEPLNPPWDRGHLSIADQLSKPPDELVERSLSLGLFEVGVLWLLSLGAERLQGTGLRVFRAFGLWGFKLLVFNIMLSLYSGFLVEGLRPRAFDSKLQDALQD